MDALALGPMCPQMKGIDFDEIYFPKRVLFAGEQDEDCLSLNVVVPGDMSDDDQGKLPVLVIIHGGGFWLGGSGPFTGEVVATFAEPIILVSINYRLGSLGFLTTGDDVIPGNQGLKDQVFALQWIQENIGAFGGDPEQVTICGESAGGESVLAHLVSPMSKGIFKKVSAQSPPAMWSYPPKEEVGSYFKRLTQALDCSAESTEAEVECLRSKPWQEIYDIEDPHMMELSQRVIDGEFIVESPTVTFSNGNYNDADLMIGFTSDDGASAIEYFGGGVEFYSNRSLDIGTLDVIISFAFIMQLNDDKSSMGPIMRNGQELSNYEVPIYYS